ncbi:MAG: hypothetical protein JO313_14810 [Verrucomicrobia bacterium]|nr:hypothetical protein [Verrucomicrobiota bacterium]
MASSVDANGHWRSGPARRDLLTRMPRGANSDARSRVMASHGRFGGSVSRELLKRKHAKRVGQGEEWGISNETEGYEPIGDSVIVANCMRSIEIRNTSIPVNSQN